MRYYCEFSPHTVNNVTPSILMLDAEMQADNNVNTILDLGCGNGRNSLYLSKKYNAAKVVLVDSDSNMLNWASHLFSLQGVPMSTVSASVEELAGNPSRFYNEAGNVHLTWKVRNLKLYYDAFIYGCMDAGNTEEIEKI